MGDGAYRTVAADGDDDIGAVVQGFQRAHSAILVKLGVDEFDLVDASGFAE